MCENKQKDVEDVENKSAEEQRETIKECLNADKVLVAATRSSRCFSLRQQIEAAFGEGAGDGEEVGSKEYIGRTLDVGGLDLYVDDEGVVWAGDDEWVRPVDLEE